MIRVKEKGECYVEMSELVIDVHSTFEYAQKICHILKQNGAPILGVIQFKPDMNYFWNVEEMPKEGKIKITWSPLLTNLFPESRNEIIH